MGGNTRKPVASDVPGRALFFELEFLATSGRAFLYEAIKRVLATEGVTLTPARFAQYFATRSLSSALRALSRDQGRAGLAAASVHDAIQAAYVSAILGDDHRNKGLIALTRDLRKHGIELGALTGLDRDCVVRLLEQLKLDPDDVHVMATAENGRAFPSAQDWLRLAKAMKTSPALCTVAATSAAACKSALCAGMRCFAVPDALTAFQDFSGADYVIDSLDMAAERLVLKLVEAF